MFQNLYAKSDVNGNGQENGSSKLCYCGKGRNLDVIEVQCERCTAWFHQACVQYPLPRLVRFLTCYNFVCKHCHPKGEEAFEKKTTSKSFAQICMTALANLFHKEGGNRLAFSKDREIIPYIDENWDALTHNHKRVKNAWHQTIMKTMLKEDSIFLCDNRDPQDLQFALRNRDLAKICPDYDNPKYGLSLYTKIDNIMQQAAGVRGSRGNKKRLANENSTDMLSSVNKRQKSDLTQPKLPPSGFPTEFPFNKESWRYFLAEPDCHAPLRQEFLDLQDKIQIPNFLFRRLLPESVALSVHDRAPQLKLTEDRKIVTGEKGYSSIRANVGVSHGTWFYEARILDKPDNSACRIGWGQELANLQAPLGYDKFGYSWRSRKGTKFHQSKGRHYADGGYDVGDIIGCIIELPSKFPGPVSKYENSAYLPKTCKDKPLIKFKSYHYFEEKDEPKMENELVPLEGSKIHYFKNGKYIGLAFENLYHGVYFPMAGLYKNITLAFNFGPYFDFNPDESFNYQPMCEAVLQNQVEQTMSDVLYLVENENELKLVS